MSSRTSLNCSSEEFEHSMHIPMRHLLSLTVLPQQCSCLLWISLQPGACAKKAQCFWGRVLLQPTLLLLHSHFPEKLPGLLQLTGLPGRPQEVRGGTGYKPPTAPGTGAGQWCQAAVSIWPLTPCQSSAVLAERNCDSLTLFILLLTAGTRNPDGEKPLSVKPHDASQSAVCFSIHDE